MWPFTLFKRKKNTKKIPARTLEELKVLTKVLFIDDKAFKVVDNIKEKDGWRNVSRIVDAESLSQTEIVEAHIIFVDIQGVGKKMSFKDGGLGLIVALKKNIQIRRLSCIVQKVKDK